MSDTLPFVGFPNPSLLIRAVGACLLALLLVACFSPNSGEPGSTTTVRSIPSPDSSNGPSPLNENEGDPIPTTTAQESSESGPPATAFPTIASSTLPALTPPIRVGQFARDRLPQGPDRDLFQLAYELLLPAESPEVEPVVNSEPVSYEAGRIDEFSLVDLDRLERYRSRYELRHVSPNAYWYVEEGFRVDQGQIEKTAVEFEEVIYPRVTDYFGSEWKPGVDNDPHLTILHGDIRGAGGYYSSSDEYPKAIRPHSNEREMIYINGTYLQFGSLNHLRVLAHELNHAILWNADSSEDTWVSEGLAELSTTIAGYGQDFSVRHFLRSPHVPLVHWPLDDRLISAHYGGASLFMHYLNQHYPPRDGNGIVRLMQVPEDNIEGVDVYLKDQGYDRDFHDLLKDWVAANFLDESQGLYGYESLDVEVEESRVLSRPDVIERRIAQYGTHYIELGSALRNAQVKLTFEGQGNVRLLPTEVGEAGCWWSNAGDAKVSTLTGEVDLTSATEATLSYDAWFSIEEDWDYAYIQVSEDGGEHWVVLETPNTSDTDPLQVAFGPGYTGESGGWIAENVDLSAYLGRQIMFRFQYVTDDALNGIGMCVSGTSITVDRTSHEPDWIPQGFVLVDNDLPQEFIVQVIQKGPENRVKRMSTDYIEPGTWKGELEIEPFEGVERAMIAVTAAAPVTRVEAFYRLTVENLDE